MFTIKALHENKDLVDDCVQLLNDEWPRSKAARLFSVSKSCSTLPYSLVLVENGDTVVGYCRLAKVISDTNSVLVESVVVDKKRRGQGLGRLLMEKAEQHAAGAGYRKMYLCTKDKQDFYQHVGYSFCQPVNTLGAQMLETCDCAPETNTPLPELNGSINCCASRCSSSSSQACCASDSGQTSAKDNKDSCCKQGSCGSSGCAGAEAHEVSGSPSNSTQSSDPKIPATPPPPAPPPPPQLPSASTPAVRIYWMIKSLAQ